MGGLAEMRGLAIAVVLALASATPAAARPFAPACTDSFKVTPSRDWNNAGDWTAGVPTPTDDVCIPAGIVLAVGTTTPVIHSLSAAGTTLVLTADFTVTGD